MPIFGASTFGIDSYGLKAKIYKATKKIRLSTINNIGIKRTAYKAIYIDVGFNLKIIEDGASGRAVRLGMYDLVFDLDITGDYTINLYRKAVNNIWNYVTIRSDGKVYIDGYLNNSYDISWLDITDGVLTIKREGGYIDELLVFKEFISEKKILDWHEKEILFYTDYEEIHIEEPSLVSMEVLPING